MEIISKSDNRTFENQDQEVMVQGIPAGCWVFVVFGALFYLIGWPVLLASNIVSGSIIITIGTIFLFCIKPYGNSRRHKKVNEYYKKEEQLKAAEQQSEEQREFEEFKQSKAAEQRSEEQREFEEFKKWRNSRKDDEKENE